METALDANLRCWLCSTFLQGGRYGDGASASHPRLPEQEDSSGEVQTDAESEETWSKQA